MQYVISHYAAYSLISPSCRLICTIVNSHQESSPNLHLDFM